MLKDLEIAREAEINIWMLISASLINIRDHGDNSKEDKAKNNVFTKTNSGYFELFRDFFLWEPCGVMVSALDFRSEDRSSVPAIVCFLRQET